MKREPFFSLFVKCHNFGHFVHFVMHPTIKTACARPEIFQDVFKLHDRDFKQCFEYEKATICDYSFSNNYEGLFYYISSD